MSELTSEEKIALKNFNNNLIDNKHIVPSINSQIYAMGKYRDNYGEEKLVLSEYTHNRSTFTITSNNQLSWKLIEAPENTENIPSVDSLPTSGEYNNGSIVKITINEVTNYYECYGIADPSNLKSTDSIKVSISLNKGMLETYPNPNIVIDGKEYTSAIVSEDFTFYMNRDHRISILWSSPDVIETYLIIANR